MKLRMFAATLVAFAMTSSPVLAQAAQKAPVSNTVARASATQTQANKQDGDSTGIILGVLAAAAIIGGIVIAAGNNDDSPASP